MRFKDYEFETDVKNSKQFKISKKEKENRQCLLCKKNLGKNAYCKSHSIPHFIIDNLQPKGTTFNLNSILNNDYLGKQDTGKNNALVFRSICKECDSKMFELYENPELYSNMKKKEDASQNILYLIKLKNVLYEMYYDNDTIEKAKELSKNGNSIIQRDVDIYNRYGDLLGYKNQLNLLKHIEMEEYWRKSAYNQIQYKKDVLEKVNNKFKALMEYKEKNIDKKLFKIGYFARLNYKIDFAFQRDLTLITDTKWNVVYNGYIQNIDYDFVSFAVFPFNNFSIIIIFVENDCTRYDAHFEQLCSMSLQEQLKRIVFDIFTLSEHILISKNVTDRQLQSLKDLAKSCDLSEKPTIDGRVNSLKKLYNKKFYYFYKK